MTCSHCGAFEAAEAMLPGQPKLFCAIPRAVSHLSRLEIIADALDAVTVTRLMIGIDEQMRLGPLPATAMCLATFTGLPPASPVVYSTVELVSSVPQSVAVIQHFGRHP